MKKLKLEIIDLTDQGHGLARTEQGQVVFVPYYIPGDIIKCDLIPIKKNIWQATNVELKESSSQRQTIPCSYFNNDSELNLSCGGCQVQALKYQEFLKIKNNSLLNKLERIAKIDLNEIDTKPIFGMVNPWHYRNNVQLKIKYNKQDATFERGFFASDSNYLVAHEQCLISQQTDQIIWQAVNSYLEKMPKDLKELFINNWQELIIRTGENAKEILLGFVFSGNCSELTRTKYSKLWHEMSLKINAKLLSDYQLTSIWFLNQTDMAQDNHIWGSKYLTEQISDKRYQIFPKSFFQVNTQQTEKLFQIIREFVSNNNYKQTELQDIDKQEKQHTLFDLYCGTGTIGIALSDLFSEVKGVEVFPDAVQNARQNARINQVKNAKFFQDRAENWLSKQKVTQEDTIIVDPPRNGLAKTLINTLNQTPASSLIYVSCHPGTLARDIKRLKSDWQIKALRPIDMFPWTMHVETVVLMSRVDK